MMETITRTQTLNALHCAACGMMFAITAEFEARRRNDHQNFYCPSGHFNYYNAKSEAEKLRDDLATKERELKAAKSREDMERGWRRSAEAATEKVTRSLRATKAVVTRTKKKIVAGRCPCCSTKFKDLAVHMRTEHPNYDPDKAAAALEAKS